MAKYVYNESDQSWFGLDDNVIIVDVPDDIIDADAVELYLQTAEYDSIKVVDLDNKDS